MRGQPFLRLTQPLLLTQIDLYDPHFHSIKISTHIFIGFCSFWPIIFVGFWSFSFFKKTLSRSHFWTCAKHPYHIWSIAPGYIMFSYYLPQGSLATLLPGIWWLPRQRYVLGHWCLFPGSSAAGACLASPWNNNLSIAAVWHINH